MPTIVGGGGKTDILSNPDRELGKVDLHSNFDRELGKVFIYNNSGQSLGKIENLIEDVGDRVIIWTDEYSRAINLPPTKVERYSFINDIKGVLPSIAINKSPTNHRAAVINGNVYYDDGEAYRSRFLDEEGDVEILPYGSSEGEVKVLEIDLGESKAVDSVLAVLWIDNNVSGNLTYKLIVKVSDDKINWTKVTEIAWTNNFQDGKEVAGTALGTQRTGRYIGVFINNPDATSVVKAKKLLFFG